MSLFCTCFEENRLRAGHRTGAEINWLDQLSQPLWLQAEDVSDEHPISGLAHQAAESSEPEQAEREHLDQAGPIQWSEPVETLMEIIIRGDFHQR